MRAVGFAVAEDHVCGVTSECATTSPGGSGGTSAGNCTTRSLPNQRASAGGSNDTDASCSRRASRDANQNLVRRRPELGHRLARNVALYELENVPPLRVDTEIAWGTLKTDPLEVTEILGDRVRPEPPRSAHSLPDPHDTLGHVPTW